MAVPVTMFVVFAVAEAVGLEPGWWGHLLQLTLAVLLTPGAWIRPRVGGPALIVAGTLLAVSFTLAGTATTRVTAPP